MSLGIGGIAELIHVDRAGRAVGDLPGSSLGAGDAVGLGGDDDLAAEGAHQASFFDRELLWHHQHDTVSETPSNHGQREPGVAGRCLDHGAARFQAPVVLRPADESEADAILDGEARVEALELGPDLSPVRILELLETEERGLAYEVED